MSDELTAAEYEALAKDAIRAADRMWNDYQRLTHLAVQYERQAQDAALHERRIAAIDHALRGVK